MLLSCCCRDETEIRTDLAVQWPPLVSMKGRENGAEAWGEGVWQNRERHDPICVNYGPASEQNQIDVSVHGVSILTSYCIPLVTLRKSLSCASPVSISQGWSNLLNVRAT